MTPPGDDVERRNLLKSQTLAAWISAVSALIAIPLALFALYQARKSAEQSAREQIVIEITHRPDLYRVSLTPYTFPDMPFLMNTIWHVVLANNSERAVSVVEYDIVEYFDPRVKGYSQHRYTGLSGGMLNADGHGPAALPLSIESGKSAAFCIIVGAVVGRRAEEALRPHLSKGAALSLAEGERIVAERGVDLYDNPVKPIVLNGNFRGWFWGDRHKEQHLRFTVRTARGSKFSTTTTWPQRVWPPTPTKW